MLGNTKASLWLSKREDLWTRITRLLVHNTAPIIWMHASSRGETEQALPVARHLKKQYPNHKILLTIFSPSGERLLDEIDYLCYIPLDTRKNAEKFLTIVNPQLIIWVKYDFWKELLLTAQKKAIPIILICATFRSDQIYFHPLFVHFFKNIFSAFSTIYVQSAKSKVCLETMNLKNTILVGGDTRFLQVDYLSKKISIGSRFQFKKPIIVCGSTYYNDEVMLHKVQRHFRNYTFVIVPHNVSSHRIRQLKALWNESLLFSEMQSHVVDTDVFIVDTVGLLNELYFLSEIAYIGGGLNRTGIHNVLEPAAFGKPILIGTNFSKYDEAKQMVAQGICLVINDSDSCINALHALDKDATLRNHYGQKSRQFISENMSLPNNMLTHKGLAEF